MQYVACKMTVSSSAKRDCPGTVVYSIQIQCYYAEIFQHFMFQKIIIVPLSKKENILTFLNFRKILHSISEWPMMIHILSNFNYGTDFRGCEIIYIAVNQVHLKFTSQFKKRKKFLMTLFFSHLWCLFEDYHSPSL